MVAGFQVGFFQVSSTKSIVKILENDQITKIGHYLRYDVSGLEYFLKCNVKNIFDTKIASKLCRTYSQSHGLKDLVMEFCNKKMDKRREK